jgi:hypothetical protein
MNRIGKNMTQRQKVLLHSSRLKRISTMSLSSVGGVQDLMSLFLYHNPQQ